MSGTAGSAPVPGPNVSPRLRPALDEIARVMPTDLSDTADLLHYRSVAASRATTVDVLCEAWGVMAEERQIGACAVTVFRATGIARARVIYLHGGGLVAGNRYDSVDVVLRHARELGLEVWTVEYPLAPESPFGHTVAAILQVLRAADAPGVPILLAGQSAGGGLAAAAGIAARDAGVRTDGLLLVCPMLEPAGEAEARRFASDPSWSPISNATAWTAALALGDVPPGQQANVSGLPPTYLDTGSAELFCSAIMRFGARLWEAGVAVETHVWSGGFHAFDCVDEAAPVSIESHRVRGSWLRRWADGDL